MLRGVLPEGEGETARCPPEGGEKSPKGRAKSPEGKNVLANIKETEVAVVRVKITLACEECKQRNYNLTKEKKTHPDRMETKKYCKFCKAHTMHKETK